MLSSNTEIIKTDEFIFEENGWVAYVGKQDYGMTYDEVKIKNNTDYENFSFDIDLPECGYCEVPGNKRCLYNINDIAIIHSSGSKVLDVQHVEEYIEAIDDTLAFLERLKKYMLENDWIQ